MKPAVLLGGSHAAVVQDMLELNDYPVNSYLPLRQSSRITAIGIMTADWPRPSIDGY